MFKKNKYKIRTIKHGISLNGFTIVLKLQVRRFKCHNCKKVFTEQIKDINNKRSSRTYRYFMLSQLQATSINYVSKKFYISSSTVKRYLLDFYNKTNQIDWKNMNINALGIDEHSFQGKRMFTTITDLTNKEVVSVLSSDDKTTIGDFIDSIPKEIKANIKESCSDLRSSFKNIIQDKLPNSSLVADRFHVETLARRMVDDTRKIIQDRASTSRLNAKIVLWKNKSQLTEKERLKLNKIFATYSHFPKLKEAWIIKEKLIDVYHSNNKQEARKKINHLIMLLDTITYPSKIMNTFKNTIIKWKEPILNYFDNRTTNGFTEGIHTKFKLIKRISYGFKNPFLYIAKIRLSFMSLEEIKLHTI